MSFLEWWGNIDWEATWAMLESIATIFLAGGIIFVFLQVREARRSNNAQLAAELFRELRSEASKETLRLIYSLKPDKIQELHSTTSIARRKIDNLLDKFEMLGSLVNHRIVDKHLAIEAFGGAPALRCWYKLVNYIREETDKRGYFLDNYETFTRESLKYFDKRDIEVNFYEEAADGTIESKTPLPLVTWLMSNSLLRPRNQKEIKRDRKRK